MTRSIKGWQRDAHALAVEKGFHSRECKHPGMDARDTFCIVCNGTGRVPVDPHSPTRIAARLALIHCEISEAVECVARGQMILDFPTARETEPFYAQRGAYELVGKGHKPEGFPIELADVFLRLCDLAESLDFELEDSEVSARLSLPCGQSPEELSAALCMLHDALPHAYTADDEDLELQLTEALGYVQWIAVSTGINLLEMASLKHEFNKGRPIRHGGKIL